MTEMATEDITVFDMLEDLDPTCDYAEDALCPKASAKWIMFRAVCTCGLAGAVLACTDCKELRMTSEDAVVCHRCGEVYAPARHRYSRVEAL